MPDQLQWNPDLRYRQICGRHIVVDTSSGRALREVSPLLGGLLSMLTQRPFIGALDTWLQTISRDSLQLNRAEVVEYLKVQRIVLALAEGSGLDAS